MANAFNKPIAVVDTAIQLLQRDIVLPNLVWRDGLGDFAGKFNDTITVRVPGRTFAHTRVLRGVGAQRNLTASDLTEYSFPVTLTDDVYHLVLLTDEEKTLDIRDFAVQVLNRQVRAVAEKLEDGLRETIVGAPYGSGVHEVDASDFYKGVLAARRALNDAHVPQQGRVMIVGSAVEEAILGDDRFIRYDSQGQAATTALMEARVGRIYGFDVVRVDNLPAGDAYVYHPTAFIMATRAPSAPLSGADRVGAVAAEGGIALRWLGDYDPTITSDRSLVDTFVGYKAVSDPEDGFVRARRIHIVPTGITASADKTEIEVGEKAMVTVVDSNGDDVTKDATFVSTDPTKATVNADGVVTGVGAGTTQIVAEYVTAKGTLEADPITITVTSA